MQRARTCPEGVLQLLHTCLACKVGVAQKCGRIEGGVLPVTAVTQEHVQDSNELPYCLTRTTSSKLQIEALLIYYITGRD